MKLTIRNICWGVATFALLALFAVLDEPQPRTQLRAAPEVTPLDRVPADSAIFAHFRADNLWNHPIINDVRKTMPKEAERFLTDAQQTIGVAPMDVDTITFYYPRFPENPADSLLFVLQVTTKKPFDQRKILASVRLKKDPIRKDGIVKLEEGMLLVFTGDKQFAVLHETLLTDFNQGASKIQQGPMAKAISQAKQNKANLVASLNPATLPADLFANAPAEVQPFLPLLKSNAITLTASIADEFSAEVRFQSENMDKAIDNERAFNLLTKLAIDGLEDLLKETKSEETKLLTPFLKNLLVAVKQVKANRVGNDVTASIRFKADPAIAKPIVQLFLKPSQAAARSQTSNNMKQLGLAMHNYAATNNDVFPAASICDKKGKPLLSWRVAILPYIEQSNLYKQFKLDEPWDSEHNLKLAKSVVVKVFQSPGIDTKPGYTHYRAFVGADAGFDYVQGRRIPADFPDGSSNTILLCESAEAVLWTKPDELDFDPKKPIKPLLHFREGNVCMMLFADGSVRAVTKTVSEETLQRVIMRNDGMVIGKDLD